MKNPPIYYLGKQIYPRQKRDKKGRFTKGTVSTYLAMLLLLGIMGDSLYTHYNNNTVSYSAAPLAMADTIKVTPDKIESAKDKLVDDISACETKGVKEPDATIILDSNHEMSIGSMQFQILTIQHYVKQFQGKDISRTDAIALAINHQQAHDLAKQILFTEKGGEKNWLTCSQKLDAATKISVIESLE